MNVELSPHAESVVQSLLAEGGDAQTIVEQALTELAERRQIEQTEAFIDPSDRTGFGLEGVRQRIAEAEADLEAGRVSDFDPKAALRRSLGRTGGDKASE